MKRQQVVRSCRSQEGKGHVTGLMEHNEYSKVVVKGRGKNRHSPKTTLFAAAVPF